MVGNSLADLATTRHFRRERADGSSDMVREVLGIDGGVSGTSSTADCSTNDATSRQEVRRPEAQRGPNRYYDLTTQRAGGPVKKVCWVCGMEGHEKPECPNSLCRQCHCVRGYHHVCQELQVSPFVTISYRRVESWEMSSVKCVSCAEVGHFDCRPVLKPTSPSCCFCGEEGHNAFNCKEAAKGVFDPWWSKMLALVRCYQNKEVPRSYTPSPRFRGRQEHSPPNRGNTLGYCEEGARSAIDSYQYGGEARVGYGGSQHSSSRLASRATSWGGRGRQVSLGRREAPHDFHYDQVSGGNNRSDFSSNWRRSSRTAEHASHLDYVDTRGKRQRDVVPDSHHRPRDGRYQRPRNYPPNDDYYDNFF